MTHTRNRGETIDRILANVKISEDEFSCWEWKLAIIKDGYGQISIKHKSYQVHRIAYGLMHGEIPEGLQVLHHCDNPKCCNPNHLFLGTHADNMKDKKEKNRTNIPKGESNWGRILSDEQVEEARDIYKNTPSKIGMITKLAKQFNVSKMVMSRIISRKRNYE